MNFLAASQGRNSPTVAEFPSSEVQQFVGAHHIESVGQGMTDEEREDAIYRAGNAMQAWYSRYQHDKDPQWLDMAYECLGMQRKLIAGRSPEQVARMEQERGIA